MLSVQVLTFSYYMKFAHLKKNINNLYIHIFNLNSLQYYSTMYSGLTAEHPVFTA